MPIYIGKYLADTLHLSRDQHGGYLLLIFAYWRLGRPLPDDDAQLAAIVKASPREWKKSLRPILQPFFTVSDGLWRHKRIDIELSMAVEKTTARSIAGKIGAEARWQSHHFANGNGHAVE